MEMLFYINALLLGIGLAMDAFSVSIANGLNDPKMKKTKMFSIATIFGLFQFAMPLIGWFLVHSFVEKFKQFEKYIPYIALLLLLYIGGKMLIEGIKNDEEEKPALSVCDLLIQGVATSIDALSVGFTICELNLTFAFIESAIIGIVTLFICLAGILIGKTAGNKLSNKATIIGGLILIIIGIEIFIKGVF